VFAALCEQIGLGSGRTHADVGAHGVPVASWEQHGTSVQSRTDQTSA
jgi:hypothetical protein